VEVVSLWADGLYVKAGPEDTKAALLVMIGVLANGQKVMFAVESRQQESKESWGNEVARSPLATESGGQRRSPCTSAGKRLHTGGDLSP
jgi:hypothetical protein